MKNENKYFIIILSVAALLVMGVITENVITATKPKHTQITIDVEKVKQEIDKAGLVPREAKYWKQL